MLKRKRNKYLSVDCVVSVDIKTEYNVSALIHISDESDVGLSESDVIASMKEEVIENLKDKVIKKLEQDIHKLIQDEWFEDYEYDVWDYDELKHELGTRMSIDNLTP